MRSAKTYLGRAGRIHGPYDETDLERLRAGGADAEGILPDGLTLDDIRWLWDGRGDGWRPIEAPPPAPGSAKAGRIADDGVIQALCVDRGGIVAGVLNALSETGCRLETPDPSATPPFMMGGTVLLNLLDPSTNRSINLRVKFVRAQRRAGGWSYEIRWPEYPRFQ